MAGVWLLQILLHHISASNREHLGCLHLHVRQICIPHDSLQLSQECDNLRTWSALAETAHQPGCIAAGRRPGWS